LAEQQRIVAKVVALLARVNATRERLAKMPAILKRFRQSVLAGACSGRLTEDWAKGEEDLETSSELIDRILLDRFRRFEQAIDKSRNNGTKPPRKPFNLTRQEVTCDVPLFELPEHWEWVTWNDLTDWITYGFTRPMPHVPKGIPIVSAKNVRDGFLDLQELDYTTLEAFGALSEKDRPQLGEILITKDGAIRGRAVLVDTDQPFCITQAVAVLRFGGLTAHRPYLLRVIQSRFTQRLIEEESSGTAIPHISITDFGRFPVPVPPLAEQHEIVRRVEAVFGLADAIEKRVAAATTRADNLMQAILTKAFRGELVPTEAELARREGREYEPASVLLDRIWAERAEGKSDAPQGSLGRRRKRVT
jgi:type I restriction enzyme S subunit